MPYVYRHIRLDTNMPFYIGIGTGYRANQWHKRNKYWTRIANKHGYEIEILMTGLTWEEACAKEIEFIALYGRKDNGTGILANLTDGGDGVLGFRQTEKAKRLASERMKGNKYTLGRKLTKEHIESSRAKRMGNKYCLGRVLSEHTKEKIKTARQKQKPTNAKAVVQYDLNGNFIAEYESASDAERKTGFYAYLITAACRKRFNGKSVYKKFVWKYKTEVTSDGLVNSKIEIDSSEKYLTDFSFKRGPTKLTWEMVLEIRYSKMTVRELAARYNITRTQVYSIKNNEQWKEPSPSSITATAAI